MLKSIFISILIFVLFASSITYLSAEEEQLISQHEPINPIFKNAQLNKSKVLLGEKLFFDTRLSVDNSISCASCHLFALGGADGKQFAIGIKQQVGPVNTPSIFNAAYNIAQFWDGRADSLEQQARGPVENPIEMGEKWPNVIAKLTRDKSLQKQFQAVYQQPISIQTITDAIAEFERSLVTINAPFDNYLRGDQDAISAAAKKGYALFKSYGCISCHQGVNVGGNMFHKMGALEAYYEPEEEEFLSQNLGRYNLTKDPLDRYVFKVPGLRMVTLTAPYFHDGSVKTLNETIKKMARYQLLREIPDSDIELMIAFLETLVGEYERVKP